MKKENQEKRGKEIMAQYKLVDVTLINTTNTKSISNGNAGGGGIITW